MSMSRTIVSQGTTDLLAGFRVEDLLPSTSIVPHFSAGGKYPGMLEIDLLKLIKTPLAKKHGLLVDIVCVLFEYRITFDRWPGLPEHVDNVDNGIFSLPIKVYDTGRVLTKEERDKFEDMLARGEENLGPFYAFADCTLMPDPRANQRMAPMGVYAAPAGMTDENGQPITGLHPNWATLIDYSINDGVFGFPVVCSPRSGYLNPVCVDKATFTAQLLRAAEARDAAQRNAEGFSEVALDSMGGGNESAVPMPWE